MYSLAEYARCVLLQEARALEADRAETLQRTGGLVEGFLD
jgi:hypothetical protein